MSYKIYIPQDIDEAGINYLTERGYELKKATALDPETLKAEIAECQGMVLRTVPVTRDFLEAAKELKVISRFGVGLDNVDLPAAKVLGIYVLNTPEANIQAVAEHTMGLMIACVKNFNTGNTAVRTQRFMEEKNTHLGFDLAGKRLGLLGFGKIARDVARKALAFDMEVTAFDPFCNPATVPEGITLVNDRDEFFKESDLISVHIPVTPDTKESIGSAEFAMMKSSAYFINASRGQLVKEKDLAEALSSRSIAGAATDVFYNEPPEEDNPLLALDNIFFTPHHAGITVESFVRMGLDCAKGLDDVLQGRTPRYPVVTPEK